MENLTDHDILLMIYQDVKGLKEDVSGLKQDVSVLKQDVSGLKEDVSGLKEDVSGLKQDVEVLKENVRNLNRTVAKIEFEHGEKLQVLFDAFQGNTEKNEVFDKRLTKCEKKVEHNSDKIYYLETKVQAL